MADTKERYERVNVYKYGKNGWRAFLEYYECGKRKQKTKKLAVTGRSVGARRRAEAEAEELRVAENASYEEGKRLAAMSAGTVYEYLGKYIEGRSYAIEPSTASEYRRVREKLLGDEFGGIRLDELKATDVEQWVGSLAKRYAPSTVRKALVLVRSMLSQAVERELIRKNPARSVKGPRITASRPNALDGSGRAKVTSFIAIDPASPTNVGFALALYLGMREEEICGLQWRHVDLETRTISIERAIGHKKDGKGKNEDYLKATKNGSSRRTLPIPDPLLSPLSERRRHCIGASMRYGLELEDMFVIGRDDGTWMPTHYISTQWRKTAGILGLVGTEGKRPTFHDLRHTFATAAISMGTDVKTVSSILGHANAAMTLNVYASADEDAKRRGVASIAEQLEREAEMCRRPADILEFGRSLRR